jgi:hypothetical protein
MIKNPAQTRIDEYSKPPKCRGEVGGPNAEKNMAYWQDRATENSQIAPRAKGPVHGGPPGTRDQDLPSLPSTKVTVRDSSMRPKVSRNVDRLMKGDDEPNHKSSGGSNYMKGIRRTT